jgi:hypothetical protein
VICGIYDSPTPGNHQFQAERSRQHCRLAPAAPLRGLRSADAPLQAIARHSRRAAYSPGYPIHCGQRIVRHVARSHRPGGAQDTLPAEAYRAELVRQNRALSAGYRPPTAYRLWFTVHDELAEVAAQRAYTGPEIASVARGAAPHRFVSISPGLQRTRICSRCSYDAAIVCADPTQKGCSSLRWIFDLVQQEAIPAAAQPGPGRAWRTAQCRAPRSVKRLSASPAIAT